MSATHHVVKPTNQALGAVQDAMDDAMENFAHAKGYVEDQVVNAKNRLEEHVAVAKEKALAAKEQLETNLENAVESGRESLHQTIDRTKSVWRRMAVALRAWIDTDANVGPVPIAEDRIDFVRTLPFIAVHLMCLGVFFVGWSWFAVGTAIALYWLRMFAITGFYHRYFSHKSFKTSRVFQFVMGLWGASAVQRGPLWWAANHRHHHKTSDQPEDFHSPVQYSFWWSHMGWIMGKSAFHTDEKQIPDLAKYPELRWLDRFDLAVPIALGALMFFGGMALEKWAPGLGTNGMQMLVWGFFVSTVVLFHGTVTINSLSHVWGSRRYKTKDDSRNNWFLAIITLGEGWHNNHHHFPGAARQGFFWWEYDVTYYLLQAMSKLGLIWDLKPVPVEFKNAHLKYHANDTI